MRIKRAFALLLGVGILGGAQGCGITENLDELKGDAASTCVKKTCESLGAGCGVTVDGCGSALDCGSCPDGQYCGGNGENQCGDFPCKPATCATVGAECGQVSDGCGALLDCGNCTGTATCGGAGKANECGCKPKTCAELGTNCGTQHDGCGGTFPCGACKSGEFCGGGGPNKCGTAPCMPTSCAAAGKNCGSISDGCGNTLECGSCQSPDSCAASNTCVCVLTTCDAEGANCGSIPDGCGANLDCGSCTGIDTCGGSGPANVCGSACGEAACVTTDGTYGSHFTELGCVGTESYYTPYDNYGFDCRPWSASGAVCGVTLSTVTNKSFKDAVGVCHDDWPNGNTLTKFVRVYR